MLIPLLSKPQSSLPVQAKRLVAMRFLIYTGFQTSYFIGVIGTLTYADDASVVATSLAVLFMNVFVILGSFAGGAALDAWGPRHHFLLSIVGTVTTGAAIIAFGSATGIVLLGAVLLGFVMGFAQPIATSYPAYLTDDPVELKDINSAIAMFSNVSIIVGPTLGGFVAATASSRAVFVLMMLFTALALIAGWGFRPQASHVAGDADADSAEEGERAGQSPSPSASTRVTFATSIKTVFTNSVLALLFCIIFLSNFGYGAFDPLESFFYRDVLHVGVEWMGWLSSASGVGAVLGAVVALRLPPHLVNLKTLLMALMSVGLGRGNAVRGRSPCRPDCPGRGLGRRQPAPQHDRANDGPARAARSRQLGHGFWQHVRRRGAAGDCPVAGGDVWCAADAHRGGHGRDGGSRGAAAVWTPAFGSCRKAVKTITTFDENRDFAE